MGTSFILRWLQRQAIVHSPKTDPNNGNKILFHGMPILILGIICIGMAVLLICIAHSGAPPKDNTERLIFIIIVLFFSISGIATIMEYFKGRVEISSDGIFAKAPWPWYPKKISWSEISEITISPIYYSFVINSVNKKIRVSFYMYGIDCLCDCFRLYLNSRVYFKADKMMQSFKK